MITEKQQQVHRTLNTTLLLLIAVAGVVFVTSKIEPLYDELSGLKQEKVERVEIAQLMEDEGLRLCKYSDSLGNTTIGAGHLVLDSDNLANCISSHKAIELLVKDYNIAKESVDKRYEWAEGETRLILINMTFQLGGGRLAKFTDTLDYLKTKQYVLAAGEVLDSTLHKQAPRRIERHAARMLALSNI
jgi:GH24 family phage-related lysozyme (muramidase)